MRENWCNKCGHFHNNPTPTCPYANWQLDKEYPRCRDCRWYSNPDPRGFGLCLHKNSKTDEKYLLACLMRNGWTPRAVSDGYCGPTGLLFEPMPRWRRLAIKYKMKLTSRHSTIYNELSSIVAGCRKRKGDR